LMPALIQLRMALGAFSSAMTILLDLFWTIPSQSPSEYRKGHSGVESISWTSRP
jgi:hypothetical protein